MVNLNLARELAIKNGAVKAEFVGSAPQLPTKYILNEGDEIYIPKDLEPLAFEDPETGYRFTFLYVTVKDTKGTELPFKLFPSIFSRKVLGIDGSEHFTGGNLIHKLCQFEFLTQAMEFLAGRTIVVTHVEAVECRDPYTHCTRVKRVYSFDLV